MFISSKKPRMIGQNPETSSVNKDHNHSTTPFSGNYFSKVMKTNYYTQ